MEMINMKYVEKVYFANEYFSRIKKVVRFREASTGVGEFDEYVIIHYYGWFKFTEKIIYSSKSEADKAFEYVKDIMNHQSSTNKIHQDHK